MLTPPYPGPSTITDAAGRPVGPNTWFYFHRWPYPAKLGPDTTGLSSCFLWRLEETKSGKYMLVAYGENKRLRFTHKRSRELISFCPSVHMLLQDYPLEWSRWLASGVGVYLTDSGLDIMLHTQLKQGRGSTTLDWRGMRKPYTREEISWWLMETLYVALHYRKAVKTEDREGEEMVRQAVLKFIKTMERREAAGRPSIPPKRERSA
ncbi:hypothetical protein [Hymenobacter fodinae]|uniref:Uncharacterized protein n=1 Tax=Hymenobacter fodinae TaxID=2510796 RepID=A0A4Z0PA37_9BACT|nr:hypothetical protein [Hymenobacter fodinae]TGE08768.1 hypothetical protein EU556_13865 [Hymenobacter fodinae]